MIGILGILVVFAMVFGGAAVGAFLISNSGAAIKHTAHDIAKVFKGPRWRPTDYRDLLCLLYELIRIARQNPVELEEHIEAPDDSALFARYPRIRADAEAVNLITDTLRSASMNYDDPHQVEEVLEKRMETSQHDALHSAHALQTMADGLPALGIVAAVLGVIKTMASIDQTPEILGEMIGGALVGTFLGVFMAYGFIGPFAAKVRDVVEEDAHFYQLIREVLVANLHQHAANLCIEVGRQNTPAHKRPAFAELEEALKALRQGAA